MNIGFALANSGVNDIAGVAGDLLKASDNQQQNDLAVSLFSMLLPSLLQSFTGSGGSGNIGTGNATAVGNQSQTYVHQLAEAASSGDGIASIIQDVLVANVGAAGANTGVNTIGGRYADLDPEAAKAVVTLAAFLSQMLALVHTQSASTALAMQQQGLEIPFGDIVLTVQGQLQGYDTVLTGATGQQATIHQITIILSLGIANSNTGLNSAIGVNSQSALAASVNGAFTDTGDADARNGGMVIICQRRNADDVECLAPPTTTTPEQPPDTTVPDTPLNTVPEGPTTPTTIWTTLQPPGGGGPHGFSNPNGTSTHGSTNPLPSTGSNVADILLYAGLLTLLGFGLLVLAHRRQQKLVPALAVSHHGDDDWSLVPPPEE
jgi:LPXTG-motif cell wall-anchored protein